MDLFHDKNITNLQGKPHSKRLFELQGLKDLLCSFTHPIDGGGVADEIVAFDVVANV